MQLVLLQVAEVLSAEPQPLRVPEVLDKARGRQADPVRLDKLREQYTTDVCRQTLEVNESFPVATEWDWPSFPSRAADATPNLVAIQIPALDMLPTVLVCPIQEFATPTDARVTMTWQGRHFTVLCDLARPINLKSLACETSNDAC
jgi:hypothetical protein